MIAKEETRPNIQMASVAESDRAIGVITLAFVGDPAVRWLYPDPHQYYTYWPQFVRAFGGRAFEHGSAQYAGTWLGVALWLPPGVQPDDEVLESLLRRSVAGTEQEEVFAFIEQMGGYHPSGPHWYLPLIGVDPICQGQGYGSALLRSTLERLDRNQQVAYLESSNPRNVPLYQRHGFEVTGTIQTATSPPIWPMVRKPR